MLGWRFCVEIVVATIPEHEIGTFAQKSNHTSISQYMKQSNAVEQNHNQPDDRCIRCAAVKCGFYDSDSGRWQTKHRTKKKTVSESSLPQC